MSDDRITVTQTEITVVETTIVAPPGIIDHWCEFSGCAKWGSFGFERATGYVWLCGEHHPDPVFAAKVKSMGRHWEEG